MSDDPTKVPQTNLPSELLVMAAIQQLREQPGTVATLEQILLLALDAIRGDC